MDKRKTRKARKSGAVKNFSAKPVHAATASRVRGGDIHFTKVVGKASPLLAQEV